MTKLFSEAELDLLTTALAGSATKWFGREIDERSVQCELQIIRQSAIRQFGSLKCLNGFCVMLLTERLPGIEEQLPTLLKMPLMGNEYKQTQYNLIQVLADRGKAAFVAMISEVWMSRVSKTPHLDVSEVSPEQDPNRHEYVLLTVLSRFLKPQKQAHYAKIFRPKGQRPYLGPFIGLAELARSMGDVAPQGDRAEQFGPMFDLLPSLHRDN